MSTTVMQTSTAEASSTFVAADYTPGPDFMGWYLSVTPASPVTCGNGGVYHTTFLTPEGYTTGYDFGACSYTDNGNYPTACSDGTLLYNDGGFGACASSLTCGEISIYPTDHAADEYITWAYQCFQRGDSISLCRTLPAEYDKSTVAAATTNAGMNPSPSATETPGITSTSTSISTSSPDYDPSSSAGSSGSSGISGGAIGGIVVGCIAGVVILLFLLFRKRIMACFGRGKPPGGDDGPYWSPVPPQTESVSHTDHSTMPPSEMPSEQNAIHEMETQIPHEIGSSTSPPMQEKIVHELG
ncbi:hypothetical protein N7478_005621 [Penicillium angulare]|uniref:uncharacterized protein n=1 Tax=Penicillium angulare TaxID=116970 RepID=UPI00253FCC76|nr:uncharacterized protein N7478_005621 [Penicillium angulare]KAJ5280249.1 hypothetical protein N7478_005621 [Penicillium angulare]